MRAFLDFFTLVPSQLGRNSVLILPDDYKFKGDGSDSHRWREIKDQVLNKAMSGQGFKMSLLETKPVPDEDIYKNSTGVFTISGKIALEKKKEEIDKDQMKVFGILIKHIEPNSRAWAIIGDLVKDSDPVAVYKKLKDTYDADSTAGFFEMIEKFYDPPGEEDLLHFLNRKYKELYDFESFGKTSSIDEDGLTVEETPHKISETVKVLTVFALARKIRKYAIEMDDFVTEHLLNLQFDSVDLKFSILYEKSLVFVSSYVYFAFVFTSAFVSFLTSNFIMVSNGFDFVFVLFRLRFNYSVSAFRSQMC